MRGQEYHAALHDGVGDNGRCLHPTLENSYAKFVHDGRCVLRLALPNIATRYDSTNLTRTNEKDALWTHRRPEDLCFEYDMQCGLHPHLNLQRAKLPAPILYLWM